MQSLVNVYLLIQISFGQTGKLTKIPGTKCSLIPPAGFVAATKFSGFQQVETGASIMINELPVSYQSLFDGFTTDALRSGGVTLNSKETIDFKNTKATLINAAQTSQGTTYIKQVLIFGDSNVSVLVNGIYPEASKEIEVKIKEALLSTIYNTGQNDDPLTAASFTVDVEGTDFKPVKFLLGSVIYSTDGKMPTEKPTLIVGNSLAKVSIENPKKYAEERFNKLPGGYDYTIKETREITIDNLTGYEIVAEGKDKNGNTELAYQVMLFNGRGDYFRIPGQAKEDFGKNLETFKKIAKTFKRRQAENNH